VWVWVKVCAAHCMWQRGVKVWETVGVSGVEVAGTPHNHCAGCYSRHTAASMMVMAGCSIACCIMLQPVAAVVTEIDMNEMEPNYQPGCWKSSLPL